MGTGTPKREFLFADDLAEACSFLMVNYNEEQLINIGTGQDLTIADLATPIKDIVGFKARSFLILLSQMVHHAN
jgi:GDP-L-fucose synthase